MIFFVYNKIRILHQNINGLINKSDLLVASLKSLESVQDIICLTEHNMSSCDLFSLNIPNYSVGSVFNRKNRRGGCCILVQNSHKFTPINDIKKYSTEGIIECSGIHLSDHKLYIFCIYRPPKVSAEDFNKFFRTLDSLLNRFCFGKNKVILCGDFNINTLKKSKESTELMQIMSSFNLKIGINEPTRMASGTCIDNFMFNIRGCEAGVRELALSDHTAQILTCPVNLSYSLKYWYIQRRDYSKQNMEKFNNCLNALSFNSVFTNDDPNMAFDDFYDEIGRAHV